MLSPLLELKLDRLQRPVSDLFFAGIDPQTIVDKPCVAIVGTRKPTPYGKAITEELAITLARAGVVIISGLAFGIDSIAHSGALKADGVTIAVLPSGLGRIYPASHEALARDIQKKGCLVTEYEDNHYPRKIEFLERNRIIAALSDAVIIPEAAERSGSLNTAAHAYKMGVPIFAYPGSVTSPMSSGTNAIIKRGRAQLITSADDVLKILGIATIRKAPEENYQKDTHEYAVMKILSSGSHSVSELQSMLQIDAQILLLTLTNLEMDGTILQDDIGNWNSSV